MSYSVCLLEHMCVRKESIKARLGKVPHAP